MKKVKDMPTIRSRLSRLMGERRVRVSDIARTTGISRNMLAKLYHDRARRIDLGDLTLLCEYFDCGVGDLLEWIPKSTVPASSPAGRGTSRRPKKWQRAS